MYAAVDSREVSATFTIKLLLVLEVDTVYWLLCLYNWLHWKKVPIGPIIKYIVLEDEIKS